MNLNCWPGDVCLPLPVNIILGLILGAPALLVGAVSLWGLW